MALSQFLMGSNLWAQSNPNEQGPSFHDDDSMPTTAPGKDMAPLTPPYPYSAPYGFPQPNEMLKETPVPQTPSAPPQLFEKTPPDTFRCQRFFIYQGKTLGCDSNLRADAERLRPILNNVPDAVAQLDQYQRNQRVLRTTAYTGSAGLLVLLSGLFLGQAGGKTAIYVTGLGVFLGSLGYGLVAINANDTKVTEAVETYNRARPEDPIELQFKTGIRF